MIGGLILPDAFRVRADVFIGSVLGVLRWAVGQGRARSSERQLRTMLSFEAVGSMVQRKLLPVPKGRTVDWLDIGDIPDGLIAPLRAYLRETPGFDPDRPCDDQTASEPHEQHGHVLHALGPDLKKYLP